MSFYNVSDSKFTQRYRDESGMVFSALDCALHGGQVIYCSSELTSGLALYEALRRNHLKTAAELKQRMGAEWFKDHIWNPNEKSAVAFAECVRGTFNDQTIVITPAPFSAPGWTQPEYLAFWETLIRTRIRSVWFNQDWEFSNGCTFEFAVAQDAGLPTFDRDGNVLQRREGIEAVGKAIERLEKQGFDTAKLHENLKHLEAILNPPPVAAPS